MIQVVAGLGAGGAEVLVRDLSEEMVRRGHKVIIAYISSADELRRDAMFERDFKAYLKMAGVGFWKIGHHSRLNPFYGGFRLRRLIEEFKPDLLHIHLQYGLLFNLLTGVRFPTVYTHHADHFKRGKSFFRLLESKVDWHIAISQKNVGVCASVLSRPVSLISNAISNASFHTTSNKTEKEWFDIISVGRLNAPKNYATLIKAAAKVSLQWPDDKKPVRFRIVGDGIEHDELQKLINKLDMQDTVHLIGARSDVPELMLNSEMMVMTSIYEGMPITLIEALHAGLPIITTNVGGCSEIVEDGKNGFLTCVGDASQIADKILTVAKDETFRKKLAAFSKAKSKDFEIKKSTEKHLDLYHEMVKIPL